MSAAHVWISSLLCFNMGQIIKTTFFKHFIMGRRRRIVFCDWKITDFFFHLVFFFFGGRNHQALPPQPVWVLCPGVWAQWHLFSPVTFFLSDKRKKVTGCSSKIYQESCSASLSYRLDGSYETESYLEFEEKRIIYLRVFFFLSS